MNLTNTKIVLKRRPNPEVSEDLFDIITDTVRELNKEEFLVEVSYVSIDPAMRGWIRSVQLATIQNPLLLMSQCEVLALVKSFLPKTLSLK